jgi:hypothetical protein
MRRKPPKGALGANKGTADASLLQESTGRITGPGLCIRRFKVAYSTPSEDYVFGGGNYSERLADHFARCLVQMPFLIANRGAILHQNGVQVPRRGVPHARLDTSIGSEPGKYDGAHSIGAQEQLQMGIGEPAETVLCHHLLIALRANAIHEFRAPGPWLAHLSELMCPRRPFRLLI